MSIEVTRTAEDGLSEQSWRFVIYADYTSKVTLSLSSYHVLTRASPRHKMRIVSKWVRADQRSYFSDIKAADVPLPDDVVAEARAALNIEFVGPSA